MSEYLVPVPTQTEGVINLVYHGKDPLGIFLGICGGCVALGENCTGVCKSVGSPEGVRVFAYHKGPEEKLYTGDYRCSNMLRPLELSSLPPISPMPNRETRRNEFLARLWAPNLTPPESTSSYPTSNFPPEYRFSRN